MDGHRDLIVVGGGLSGLSLLDALPLQPATFLVEHQTRVGGFLHAAGFAEASRLVAAHRERTWVDTHYAATAIGLLPAPDREAPHVVIVRTRSRTLHVPARTVVLACGGIEEPREHAGIPGSRPAGIMTPVLVHQLLSQGYLPGHRALIYGNGRYAAMTAERMRSAGMDVTLIPPWGASVSGVAHHLQVEPPARIVEVGGGSRLEWVDIQRGSAHSRLNADTLVYAIGMIPNTRWLRGSGVALASDSTIEVNECQETSVPGIYAIGGAVVPSIDHTGSITSAHRLAECFQQSAPG